ncbi:hypothetical protein ACETIH_19165 [Microvirga arabica]|uniref:Uncharacterized protein n=1 Tax=Microvirga arabica TaxID=1128671 RepID=A0ABV6YBY0_9HYPH
MSATRHSTAIESIDSGPKPEVKMPHKVELVARAIHKAEHQELSWDGESSARQERFREYARNAISLLGEDIGVLLLALKEATAGNQIEDPRASPSPVPAANPLAT